MQIMVIFSMIAAVAIFGLAIAMMFSPKIRGKMMSNQIKATRYMMDESKDDIHNISTNMADATKDGVQITTRAIKKGLTSDEGIYCKHCGSLIDNDSKFCKSCGKEQ